MSTPSAAAPHATLIVANLTAATPFLLQEIKRRAAEQPTKFSLLVPDVHTTKAYDWSLDTAVNLLSRAAGTKVEGVVSSGVDAFESVRKALSEGSYDNIIISTLPKRRSEWLRKDLPIRVEGLGVPVIVITPPEEPSSLQSLAEQFSARTSE